MDAKETKMKVAVIGGGVAGLVATRHLADSAWPTVPTMFEQTNSLGGTWVYTDTVGKDEYGLPVHSSMYKGLRTNLPKETMMFPDFPHTNSQGVSYLSAEEVLQYLNDYADHFNIRPFVKLRHHVKRISPMGTQWKIEVIELEAKIELTDVFDAVIVCNGHNSKPSYSKVEGIEYFKGRQLHSHNYREAEAFRGLRTLVIGAGASGLDITFALSTVTDTVVLSHHTNYASKIGFPPKVILKPDLDRVTPDGSVMFKDGSLMEFDLFIHCTASLIRSFLADELIKNGDTQRHNIILALGCVNVKCYLYTYPFLAKECGITIEDNYVSPLYKGVININHPTMAFLAVLKQTPTFFATDLQVRYFLHTLFNPALLPSKQDMEAELLSNERSKAEKGLRKRDYHLVADKNPEYFDELCKAVGMTPIPSILLRIYFHAYERIHSDFKNFRYNFYRIIDQDKFTVIDIREITAKPLEKIHSNPSCNAIQN